MSSAPVWTDKLVELTDVSWLAHASLVTAPAQVLRGD